MRQMFDWLQWGLARKRVGGPALGDIANRLNTIRGQDGAAAISHTHYTGTCSLIAGTFPLRFFNRIGATEVDPDTVCNKAGHVALQLMYGESTRGFDPRTIDGTRCVMILGANPSTSAPHVHQYWLSETHVPKIVVDPIRHETAAAANIHLQLHPGTDDALAYMGGASWPRAHRAGRRSRSNSEPRGVILAYKSRWTANGIKSNVNALNPGSEADLAERELRGSQHHRVTGPCLNAGLP